VFLDADRGMEWEGGEPKVNKRKRVKVSNAAKILNKIRPGKSTGLGARTPVRNFSTVVNSRRQSDN